MIAQAERGSKKQARKNRKGREEDEFKRDGVMGESVELVRAHVRVCVRVCLSCVCVHAPGCLEWQLL